VIDWLAQIPLSAVERVTFYKRDELTTDLICCDVTADGQVWFCHEEAPEWHDLLAHLSGLPGFDQDWFAKVFLPVFAHSETVAFSRD